MTDRSHVVKFRDNAGRISPVAYCIFLVLSSVSIYLISFSFSLAIHHSTPCYWFSFISCYLLKSTSPFTYRHSYQNRLTDIRLMLPLKYSPPFHSIHLFIINKFYYIKLQSTCHPIRPMSYSPDMFNIINTKVDADPSRCILIISIMSVCEHHIRSNKIGELPARIERRLSEYISDSN